MSIQNISFSDVISIVEIAVPILLGGIIIFKLKSKNKNIIEGNRIQGNLIGGNRIVNKDISSHVHSSNKNIIKGNIVDGDLIAGDDLSQQ